MREIIMTLKKDGYREVKNSIVVGRKYEAKRQPKKEIRHRESFEVLSMWVNSNGRKKIVINTEFGNIRTRHFANCVSYNIVESPGQRTELISFDQRIVKTKYKGKILVTHSGEIRKITEIYELTNSNGTPFKECVYEVLNDSLEAIEVCRNCCQPGSMAEYGTKDADFYIKKRNRRNIGLNEIYGAAMAGANARGIEFNISKDEFEDFFLSQQKDGKQYCVFSRIEITTKEHDGVLRTLSVDRIDSNKPYEIGNIQFVHKRINIMKNDLSDEEFIGWCKLIAANN